MLYLIRTSNFSGKRKIYKVGYTDSINRRMYQYISHNPFTELIASREGDEDLESLIHYCLYSFGYRYKSDSNNFKEWFEGDLDRILYVFHLTKRSIERLIWLNRNTAFDTENLKNINSSDFVLYRRLYKLFGGPLYDEKFYIHGKTILEKKYYPGDEIFQEFLIKDHQNKITKALESISSNISDYKDDMEIEVDEFLSKEFYTTGIFREKMRMYCDFMDKHKGSEEVQELLYYKIKDPKYRKYYNYYGTKGCKAVSYKEIRLIEGMLRATKFDNLYHSIHERFRIGDRLTKKYIKQTLQIIYNDLGLSVKAKATDLKNYFDVSSILISDDTGKRVHGYLLKAKTI